jgi:hypothetical protein
MTRILQPAQVGLDACPVGTPQFPYQPGIHPGARKRIRICRKYSARGGERFEQALDDPAADPRDAQ